jgi:AcrR family transcriptional regulator
METRTPTRVGRPRSKAARRAILDAALDLAVEHGAPGLSMDAIARRAAVSKETVYRWWRSKAEVLLEALAELGEREIPVQDTGDLATDLRAFMRATARTLDGPTQRALRTLAAQAAAETGFAEEVRDRFLARRRAALGAVLQRSVDRGELRAEQAPTALDLIFGSLWYRLIFAVGPLDRRWADSVTDIVVAAATGASVMR